MSFSFITLDVPRPHLSFVSFLTARRSLLDVALAERYRGQEPDTGVHRQGRASGTTGGPVTGVGGRERPLSDEWSFEEWFPTGTGRGRVEGRGEGLRTVLGDRPLNRGPSYVGATPLSPTRPPLRPLLYWVLPDDLTTLQSPSHTPSLP